MERLNTREVFAQLAEPFPSKDIEWRVMQMFTTQNGPRATVAAYVQSRAIMNRLDEVVGPERWENEIRELSDGGILQGIRIWLDNGQSITKWDGADRTQIESTKGGISNALKRCGVLLGIGRYLYEMETQFVDIHPNKTSQQDIYVQDKKKNIQGYFTPPMLPDWALPVTEKRGNQQNRKHQNQPLQSQTNPSKEVNRIPPSFVECRYLGSGFNQDGIYELSLYQEGDGNSVSSAVFYPNGKLAKKIQEMNLQSDERIAISTFSKNGKWEIADLMKVG